MTGYLENEEEAIRILKDQIKVFHVLADEAFKRGDIQRHAGYHIAANKLGKLLKKT